MSFSAVSDGTLSNFVGARMSYRIEVNSELHVVDAAPDTPLLYVLRNDLGLNGPKFGCGLGQCGACAAIVGGKLTRTCSIALGNVGEDKVTTLEALGTVEKLHPLQRSFIDEQAAQCGYCSNGMIMAAKALLDRNPNPSEEEIKNALEDQLCRCGVQNRVVRAVRRAAEKIAR
jgi:nicotinate dehydrogenase subunit A